MTTGRRIATGQMAEPVYTKVPKGPHSLHDAEYDVSLGGTPLGRVHRRRHTGVGGPGARWAREQWGHDCWGGEAMVEGRLRWFDICRATRMDAARDIARQALGLGYSEQDPF